MWMAMASPLLLAAAGIGPNGSCIKAGEVEGPARAWYRNAEEIKVGGRIYVKYGLPRDVPLDLVEWIADHDGVPVMAEKGVTSREVIYLLAGKSDCSLQPYQVAAG